MPLVRKSSENLTSLPTPEPNEICRSASRTTRDICPDPDIPYQPPLRTHRAFRCLLIGFTRRVVSWDSRPTPTVTLPRDAFQDEDLFVALSSDQNPHLEVEAFPARSRVAPGNETLGDGDPVGRRRV
jgi:hypothetical protein